MENRKKRLFIQSAFPAPYRVGVFAELNRFYDIFVAFERNNDSNRSSEWFVKEFGFEGIIMDNAEARAIYKKKMKDLGTFDAVLAYEYANFFSAKLMIKCLMKKIPYFINCDGGFINGNPFKRAIKSFFIKRARACMASGENAELYLTYNGATKSDIYRHPFSSLESTDILPSILSSEEKSELRQKIGWPVEQKIVLSVGQFTKRKGFDILLRSWQSVDLDALLILVGGGEEEPEYRKFIHDNKMDRVKIEGFKPKKQIFDFYKAADLFVLQTREDIWGLVINEAMACGLPVITTDKCIAGLELIENGENGYIVSVNDIEQLAERINFILTHPDRRDRMARNNLLKIKDYTMHNIALKHKELLDSILDGVK